MANEKRLIDANALRKAIDLCDIDTFTDKQTICEQIAEAPTVDAVEVVHGRWIVKSKEIRPFEYVAVAECSNCHAETESKRSLYISGFSMDMVDEIVRREAKDMVIGNYCPNCGAKMDGVDEDGKL